MPRSRVVRTCGINRTARVAQLEGYFDLPPARTVTLEWDVNLPIEDRPWSVGLIVGPSGSGKSSIARDLFGDRVVQGYDWPVNKSVVDGFPKGMSIKQITGLLSSVGFSAPPSWLRPFAVLSTGEQFRVTLARALAEAGAAIAVVDEFTSVVDRKVARIGSAAVAKAVRRAEQQFIAVTCHTDVESWLQPDWIYQPHLRRFRWRELQARPPIALTVRRCAPDEWARFREHHYLNTDLNIGARCFLACIDDEPVGFTAVLPLMGYRGRWREHRTVCLPEYQGVGIGMAQSSVVGSIVTAATEGDYYSTTSHPAFIAARARSPLWRQQRAQAMSGGRQRWGGDTGTRNRPRKLRSFRMTATFEYVGPRADKDQARRMWEESFSEGRKRIGRANVNTQTMRSSEVPG